MIFTFTLWLFIVFVTLLSNSRAQISTVFVTATVTNTNFVTETLVEGGTVTVTDTTVHNVIVALEMKQPRWITSSRREKPPAPSLTLLNSIPTDASCVYLRSKFTMERIQVDKVSPIPLVTS